MYDKIDRVRKGFSDKKLSLLTIWSQIEKEAIPGCDVTVPVRKQSGWCFVHRTLVSSVWVSISADGCRICRGVLSCILKLSPLYPNFTSSFTNSSIAVSRLELFIIIQWSIQYTLLCPISLLVLWIEKFYLLHVGLYLISLLLNKRFVDSMSISPWRSISFRKTFDPVCPADKHESCVIRNRIVPRMSLCTLKFILITKLD